jgi:hypothetical protein
VNVKQRHEIANDFLHMLLDTYVSAVIQEYERRGEEGWLVAAEFGRRDQRTAQAESFVVDEQGRRYRVLCELVSYEATE